MAGSEGAPGGAETHEPHPRYSDVTRNTGFFPDSGSVLKASLDHRTCSDVRGRGWGGRVGWEASGNGNSGHSITSQLLADLFRTTVLAGPVSSHMKRTTGRSVCAWAGGGMLGFNGNNKLLSQAIKSASDTYLSAEVHCAI